MNVVEPATHLLEIVSPRTNTARLSSVEHLFGSVAAWAASKQAAPPVAFEVTGTAQRRSFLVRTTDAETLRRLVRHLGAAYPQATLRQLDGTSELDPLRIGPDEQAAVATLRLQRSGAPAAHLRRSRA